MVTIGSKTYLPRLLYLLRILCKYIARYEVVIKHFLPSTKHALVDAVMLACSTLSEAVAEEIPTGD
jgi:hypothetical protein